MMRRWVGLCCAAIAVGWLGIAADPVRQVAEVRPGVWVGAGFSAAPMPVNGFEVYMAGEMHGIEENTAMQMAYLERLYREAGLRDVVIEEDAVYQAEARAFVEGRAAALPAELCLRAGILQALRSFNQQRKAGRVRVHLVDIDSPAPAIRAHLAAIRNRIPLAATIAVPAEGEMKTRGLQTVERFERLTRNREVLGELRTIAHSIHALQAGLEVGNGPVKGSPLLDEREQAIAGNIVDLVRWRKYRNVLVFYGADHVSKAVRQDGGPEHDRSFEPAAVRLEQAGVKVFSLVMFPLSGGWRWRGRGQRMLWSAGDGSLADGTSLDRILAEVPGAAWIYVDRKKDHVRLPSDDVSGYGVDAFLLPALTTPMADRCAVR